MAFVILVACTPCFRDEQDDIRYPYFMKVELFDNIFVSETELFHMIDLCFYFFQTLVNEYSEFLKIVKTDSMCYDINLGDLEIGSYGIRTIDEKAWIFGTAMAEPRFSMALQRMRNGKEEINS
jgi:seryl-tRNA synthetase